MTGPNSKAGKRTAGPGIALGSQHGGFGASWWARRLVLVMEELLDQERLRRGRSIARAGKVLTVEITSGLVRGDVQGSQIEPFRASFTMRALDRYDRAELVEQLRTAPGSLSALATGSVPPELADLLLPADTGDLDFDCTCPDYSWPCGHSAALTYLAAQRLESEPLAILTLRGIDLNTLIDAVGAAGQDAGPGTVTAGGHFGESAELPQLPPEPADDAVPAPALLDAGMLRSAVRVFGPELSGAEDDLAYLYGRMMRSVKGNSAPG